MTFSISEENFRLYDRLVNNFIYQHGQGETLTDYLERVNKHHLKHIQQLDGEMGCQILQKKDTLACLRSKIMKTATNYLHGHIPSAYKSMVDAFDSIKDVLTQKSKRFSENKSNGLDLTFAFRGRIDCPINPFPKVREEMFHIKFEERHKVKDNRYSIRGMPSIYLGNTLYDCWVELGQPSLDNLYFSLYGFSGLEFIDLTFSYNHRLLHLVNSVIKREDLQMQYEQLIEDFLLWPLIAACSINCAHANASFKQEYIIPQMLYQLCAENSRFDGVRYHSTKLSNHNRSGQQRFMINYALPAQNIGRFGYCPTLEGKICLTEPVTTNMCSDMQISTLGGDYTRNGLLTLSTSNQFKTDETILALDKLTMHYEKILLDRNVRELRPLCGWGEEQ